MKSQFVTALTVAGVLGTAGTAMAANTDVLTLVAETPSIGDATQVLLPTPSASSTAAPAATPTPDPSATQAPGTIETAQPVSGQPAGNSTQTYSGTSAGQTNSAPQAAANANASSVVNGTTGGSGNRVAVTPTKVKNVESHDDDDENEEEDDD